MLKHFLKDELGQDLVEYSLLLIFIALLVIAALPDLGKTISNTFKNTTSILQSDASGS